MPASICPRCQTEHDSTRCPSCTAEPKPKPKKKGRKFYRQKAQPQRPGSDWRDLTVERCMAKGKP